MLALVLATLCGSVFAGDFSDLSRLAPGRVRAENGLWIETPPERRFNDNKAVVVADIKGAGVITMIHFALPQLSVADPKYMLNRDTLIQMYWDGEATPSVNVPFVDFFCDPMGQRDVIDSTLVNKKRGWNAYFAMPFRKSAKIALVYEGSEPPGEKLWSMMPCYSYVIWRTLETVAPDQGYFHAQWRQAATLTGKEDYVALEARGRGKFIGWNVTSRIPGSPGCPVDMNEKFYIDGETEPSVEFQGIEDSFGFSWGFPPEGENLFEMTGYWPYLKNGAMAYRWFINDFINFDKSLKITIGYGPNEHPMFREQFSKPGTEIQFSSTCYWYQAEPHAPFPPMLALDKRAAAPDHRFWLHPETLPSASELRDRGVKLHVMCGRPKQEVFLAEPGFGFEPRQSYAYEGWAPPIYYCRADENELKLDVIVPKNAAGKLRLFIMDPDSFKGGRRQKMSVGDTDLGEFRDFQKGKWVEVDVTPEMTADGKLPVRAKNIQGNAVVSIVEWVSSR
jgi:hypothetical protein